MKNIMSITLKILSILLIASLIFHLYQGNEMKAILAGVMASLLSIIDNNSKEE